LGKKNWGKKFLGKNSGNKFIGEKNLGEKFVGKNLFGKHIFDKSQHRTKKIFEENIFFEKLKNLVGRKFGGRELGRGGDIFRKKTFLEKNLWEKIF